MDDLDPTQEPAAGASSEVETGTQPEATAREGGTARLHELAKMRRDPAAIRKLFLSGDYPYQTKIPRKEYEQKKSALQVELLKVQQWVKDTGQKIVVLFEGRDAAGKGV